MNNLGHYARAGKRASVTASSPHKHRRSNSNTGNYELSDYAGLSPVVRIKVPRRLGYLAAFLIYTGCAILTLYKTSSQPADHQYWILFAASMLVSFFVVEPSCGALILVYNWMVSQGEDGDWGLTLHPIEGQRIRAVDPHISETENQTISDNPAKHKISKMKNGTKPLSD